MQVRERSGPQQAHQVVSRARAIKAFIAEPRCHELSALRGATSPSPQPRPIDSRERFAFGGGCVERRTASSGCWLQWPQGAAEPTQYWLSNLPAETPLKKRVELAKQRWIIERDYLELKRELGLGHFEGRSWQGFHHHATLCMAAHGFLVAGRSRISASARAGQLDLPLPPQPKGYRPRGGAGARAPNGAGFNCDPSRAGR
jgi:SRSO17 transposase